MHEIITRILTGIIFGIIMLGTLFFLPPWIFSSLLLLILAYILIVEWPHLTAANPKLWFLTPLYPIAPFLIALFFNHHAEYHSLLKLLCIIVITNDTGAYFIGKFLGAHRIASSISPKKTWEGFLGGYCAVLITLVISAYATGAHGSTLTIIFFSLFCACVATAGDFFESWLKRKAGIKDAGSLLPGHGGLMDRLDSAFFLIILFFILRNPLIYFIFE